MIPAVEPLFCHDCEHEMTPDGFCLHCLCPFCGERRDEDELMRDWWWPKTPCDKCRYEDWMARKWRTIIPFDREGSVGK